MDSNEKFIRVQPKFLGDQLPGEIYSALFEVIADAEISQHLKEGQVFVVKMGPEFELLATNTLDGAVFIATPAIGGGEIILRSQDALYRIGRAE